MASCYYIGLLWQTLLHMLTVTPRNFETNIKYSIESLY